MARAVKLDFRRAVKWARVKRFKRILVLRPAPTDARHVCWRTSEYIWQKK